MSEIKISLSWFKDSKGYRINDYGKYGTTIIGNGGRLVPTRPLENDSVFLAFEKVTSQSKLLEFVHHYGLLEHPSYDKKSGSVAFDAKTFALIESRPTIRGEDVDDHLKTAQLFRDMLTWVSQKGRASDSLSMWIQERILGEKLGELSLEFVSGPGFQMCLKVDSLINGMLMQLARKVSGPTKFRVCEHCTAIFEGRRAGAKFCSERHKVEFFSQKRSKKSRAVSN